jgi:hypothetical protein
MTNLSHPGEFANRTRSRLYEMMQSRILRMRCETLKEKNPDLYEALKLSGGA